MSEYIYKLTEEKLDQILVEAWTRGFMVGMTVKPEDCECPECTGEASAERVMEAGIRECENRFEPDSLKRYN